MESSMSTSRTRLCSLCQQYYGSGLRDHVAASDILRSRRMLLDRSPVNDPGVRQGLEQFLDDISKQRTRTDMKHQQLLSVCAFCTQFLPSMYQEDKLVDDLRHQLLATGATHGHAAVASRRKASNLVIQHHLPRASSARPQSSSAANTMPQPPAQPLTYRLLTDEMTRVLQLDASTVRSSFAGGQSSLMTGDAIKDLRHQERRQSSSILTARRAAHEAKLEAAIQNRHFRGADQCLSSDIHQDRTEKRNFVRAAAASTAGGPSSLYTGIVVHPPASTRRAGEPPGAAAAVASHAKIVMGKHGRHFKSELKFPSLLS